MRLLAMYYVAELCPNGVNTSNHTGPFAFSTLCATVNVPFTVDFEALTSGSVGPSLANCWETMAPAPSPIGWPSNPQEAIQIP